MLDRIRVGPLGENAYLLPCEEENSSILVDPGDEAERILSFIDSRGLSIAGIVATHGHLDHTGALPEILRTLARQKRETPVAIHRLDAGYLGERAEETNRELFAAIRALGYFDNYWKPMPHADILLEDGDALFDSSWKVIHSPGHTRGSICLFNAKDGILISGDTIFLDGVGRTDGPDSEPKALEASLARLFALPPETIVFPGHGEPTTIGHERGSLG